MTGGTLPGFGQTGPCGQVNAETGYQQGEQVRFGRFFLDFGVQSIAVEEGQCDILRVAGAENQGNHALGDSLAFLGQGIYVGEAQLAGLDLPLHLQGGIVAQNRF